MKNKVPYPKCPFDGNDCERFGYCCGEWFEVGKVSGELFCCPRFKPRKDLDKGA